MSLQRKRSADRVEEQIKKMITLEQGALKQTVVSGLQDLDTSTELKLYFALQRLQLAFDMVGLLSWSVCQKWLDKFMSTLVSDAPSNFNAITSTQVMRADREMFFNTCLRLQRFSESTNWDETASG